MSDADAFLGSYKETLAEEISGGVWPPELAQIYEAESCLKHSGAKEVYLVTDKRTHVRVVLRASDMDAGERADIEYAILARLDFPGIPKTYGTLVKDGRSYLAREYFEGEPLDQIIARGVMHPQQIYHIARQLCALLGYLHSQRPPVIHRDIKPQNIIMRPDGSLGLTDFGIARTFKEGSASDTQYMGTLLYAPPEQYGYAQSSPQTDIYALGIVLIFLATGSPDRRDLSRRITDPQLRALIEKCIAFDPKNRFAHVGQVIKRIDAMKTRKVRLIAGIAAGGCLVLALLGFAAWQLLPTILNSLIPNQASNEQLAPENTTGLSDENARADYPRSGDPEVGSTSPLFDIDNDGNLPGNINSGGFAVMGDSSNTIYVASDDGIYQLDSEGTIVSEIYAGSVRGSLNIHNNELYFPDYNGTIHALNLDTYAERELNNTSAERIYFDNGNLYFTNMEDGLNLYSINTDGSSSTLVNDAPEALYTNVVDGVHYYSDATEGGHIYAKDLTTGSLTLLYDNSVIWLSVYNGRIYFNDDIPGVVASIKVDGTDYQMLFGNPCYFINANSHGVFAINAINKDLTVVGVAAYEQKTLLEDADAQFCIAGGWIFYRASNTDVVLGMVREDGTDNREFTPSA